MIEKKTEQKRIFSTKTKAITFKVLRTVSDGLRDIKLEDGTVGDHVAVEIETRDGDTITLCLHVKPDGTHHMHPISDNYIITQPPTDLHRTTGKLVKVNGSNFLYSNKQSETPFYIIERLVVEYGLNSPKLGFELRKKLTAFRHLNEKKQNELLNSMSKYLKLYDYLLELQKMDRIYE